MIIKERKDLVKVQWERTLLRSRWGDRKRCLKKDSNVESILPMRAKRCGFGLKILKHFDTEQSLNLKRFVSPSTSGGYEDDL